MGEVLSLSHHGLVSCGCIPCQVETNLRENTIFYGSFNFGETNIECTHSELCSIHIDACYADTCSGTGNILVECNAQCLELLSYHSCPYERGRGVLRRANGAIEKQAGQVEVHGCRL